MKFFVNEVREGSIRDFAPAGQIVIGLFKQCATKGDGDYCGYYAREAYLDTDLYAYYMAPREAVYRPENRLSAVTICKPAMHYNVVHIGSDMWTKVIEAKTVQEAIVLFSETKWRNWRFPEDDYRAITAACPYCGVPHSFFDTSFECAAPNEMPAGTIYHLKDTGKYVVDCKSCNQMFAVRKAGDGVAVEFLSEEGQSYARLQIFADEAKKEIQRLEHELECANGRAHDLADIVRKRDDELNEATGKIAAAEARIKALKDRSWWERLTRKGE